MNSLSAKSIDDAPEVPCARVAVVPGSFKPPHAGHLHGVKHLLDSGSVDEVVIVISARSKRLPGSTKAIDANASKLMWRAMLGDERRVRIEMAPDSAVKHAGQLLKNAPAGTELLFCVGEDDSPYKQEYFQSLELDSAARNDVSAKVLRLPTGKHTIHTKRLRKYISQGKQARKQYVTSLTDDLPRLMRERLWEICQSEIRDIHVVTADKLGALPIEMGIAPSAELKCARSTSQCVEFDTHADDGGAVRLKYIGDEIIRRHPDDRVKVYPRNRLASAQRCLRWLGSQHADADWFPRVYFFDESHRILAETKASPDGHTLMSEFIAGKFDTETAARLGEIIAKLHSTPVPKEPVRGSIAKEVSWWNQRRAYWNERLDIESLQRDDTYSSDPGSRCLVHLNLDAENVMVCNGQVALRAFECVSSIGDPALDILVVMSNYLTSGVATGQRKAARRAAVSFAKSYRRFAPGGAGNIRRAWQLLQGREKRSTKPNDTIPLNSMCIA